MLLFYICNSVKLDRWFWILFKERMSHISETISIMVSKQKTLKRKSNQVMVCFVNSFQNPHKQKPTKTEKPRDNTYKLVYRRMQPSCLYGFHRSNSFQTPGSTKAVTYHRLKQSIDNKHSQASHIILNDRETM